MKRILYVIMFAAVVEWLVEKYLFVNQGLFGELAGNFVSYGLIPIIITALVAHHQYTRR